MALRLRFTTALCRQSRPDRYNNRTIALNVMVFFPAGISLQYCMCGEGFWHRAQKLLLARLAFVCTQPICEGCCCSPLCFCSSDVFWRNSSVSSSKPSHPQPPNGWAWQASSLAEAWTCFRMVSEFYSLSQL